MTTLKAIETSYAGCRFRSRLEARWAVFFDELNIPWEYELQGYTVGDGRNYLPDFWLPNPGIWVEVKGPIDHEGLTTLVYAASGAGLPTSPTREAPLNRVAPWSKRLLILGNIPTPGTPWLHTRFDLVAGDLVVATPVAMIQMPRTARSLGLVAVHEPRILNSLLAGERLEDAEVRRLIDGFGAPLINVKYSPAGALTAAQAARFEFGETPEPPDHAATRAATLAATKGS
jgi:hypothetical protein